MSVEILAIIITIISGVLTLLLSVNGYLVKNMTISLKKIEIEVTRISTQHDRVIKDVDFLMRENSRHRDRLHTLEGKIGTVIKHLEP